LSLRRRAKSPSASSPARRLLFGAVLTAVAVAVPVIAAGPAAANSGRYAIGDSVMLGAKRALAPNGFAVNAKVSRQFGSAVGTVAKKAGSGRLAVNVVVHLGTNGTVALADCKKLVTAAGPGRRVFLVTDKVPRTWQNGNNKAMRRCDKAFAAERVILVDWYAASRNKPSWFVAGGFHLSSAGARAYAALIDSAVDQYGL